MNIADKIKQIRGTKSQLTLAEMINTSAAQISRWERGVIIPTRESLNKLIAALKLPQDTFINCEEPKKISMPKKTAPPRVVIHHTPKKVEGIENLLKTYKDMKTDMQLKIDVYSKVIQDLEKLL